jgi:hypothetical protein
MKNGDQVDMSVTVGSTQEGEALIADIYFNNVQWADVSESVDGFWLRIYNHPEGTPWQFLLSDALSVLQFASSELFRLRRDIKNCQD